MSWFDQLSKAVRGRRAPKYRATDPLDPKQFVYIADDGSARELEADQIRHLGASYDAADGARPSIKDSYDNRTFGGRISGYLERRNLPSGLTVRAISELEPVTTGDQAIAIAALGFSRWIGIDAKQPDEAYRAELVDGVWCVTGSWQRYGGDFKAYISAASGRLMRYGKWGAPMLGTSRSTK